MKSVVLFLTVFYSLVLSGCASIATGGSQVVSFESDPEGATVSVDGKELGVTPLSVDVKRGNKKIITVEKEGYQTYTSHLSTSVDGLFWGNILLGGLLGSSTDNASGAMYKYSPDKILVSLKPESENSLTISNDPRKRVKELVLGYGDDLRVQIANGEGEALSSLMTIVGGDIDNPEATVKVLQKLMLENADELEFAKKITDFYEL